VVVSPVTLHEHTDTLVVIDSLSVGSWQAKYQ